MKLAMLSGGVEELSDKMLGFTGIQPGRDCLDPVKVTAKRLDMKTFFGKEGFVLLENIVGQRVQLDGDRQEKLLTGSRFRIRGEDFLKMNAFPGGFGVQKNQPGCRLIKSQMCLKLSDEFPGSLGFRLG